MRVPAVAEDLTRIYALPQSLGEREAAVSRPAIKIELDERCFLFPDGKVVRHLVIASEGGCLLLDGIYDFNETRRNPRIIEMKISEAAGFARELVNAAYYGRTSFFLSEGFQATINVAQHGCLIEFLKFSAKVELMVSVPATWRVIKGVLCAIDARAPILSH
jgi:hypothetical protein